MKFITARDLRNTPGAVWKALAEHDTVALVGEGGPRALLVEIENGDLELALETLRRVRGQLALSRLREAAAKRPRISDEEIDAEIGAERRPRTRRPRR